MFSFSSRRIAACAIVLSAYAVVGAPAAERSGSVLLYHDGSAGSAAYRGPWQAAHGGKDVVVTTSADAFLTELFEGRWQRVLLLTRFEALDGLLETALLDYAQADPQNVDVRMLLFTADSERRVAAGLSRSIVLCMWGRGSTTLAYAGFDFVNPADGAARTVPGIWAPVLPTAATNAEPALTGRAPRGTTPATGRGSQPCVACENDYQIALAFCDGERSAAVSDCDAVYGPGGSQPNPPLHSTCILAAGSAYGDCVKAATEQYEACREVHNCDGGGPN